MNDVDLWILAIGIAACAVVLLRKSAKRRLAAKPKLAFEALDTLLIHHEEVAVDAAIGTKNWFSKKLEDHAGSVRYQVVQKVPVEETLEIRVAGTSGMTLAFTAGHVTSLTRGGARYKRPHLSPRERDYATSLLSRARTYVAA